MKKREADLLHLREILDIEIPENSSAEEQFQNRTLRPILKLQNNLFISVFLNYASKHKGHFFSLAPENKLLFIENSIKNDSKLRVLFIGIVVGQFTLQEFDDYAKNTNALNKRIIQMCVERLKNNVLVMQN